MSMVGNFTALPAEQASAFFEDPTHLESFLFPDDDDPGELYLDIDKAWHGVHFLLTGSADDTSSLLGQAVLGGEEFGDDLGYGPARYLAAEQVAELSRALATVDEATLRARYVPSVLTAEEIYPDIWEDEEDGFDYLWTSFVAVRDFYAKAAQRGLAIIAYLS